MNKASLESVKGFLEINLKCHGPSPPFRFFHSVKNLLGNDVIKAFPTRNKSCL